MPTEHRGVRIISISSTIFQNKPKLGYFKMIEKPFEKVIRDFIKFFSIDVKDITFTFNGTVRKYFGVLFSL